MRRALIAALVACVAAAPAAARASQPPEPVSANPAGAPGAAVLQQQGVSAILNQSVQGILDQSVQGILDQSVQGILDQSVQGILDQSVQGILDQSVQGILDSLDRTPVEFYGGRALQGFVSQPGSQLIGSDEAREAGHTGGGVIVAVIDTGVDPFHAALRGALVQGYDFTRDLPSGCVWPDLQGAVDRIRADAAAAAADAASSNPCLPGGAQPLGVAPGELDYFGHGTMVAGLIHLVAPEARIMPLKAFGADGTGDTADIVRAIHHAVDHGARVINMSFSTDSREIRAAVQYAMARGVLCVGSAGNDGIETLVFPAAIPRVFGVASTTLDDQRAPFSNYGGRLVKLAAPGVNLITIWPAQRYAIVSGTSFSAGLASGAAALLAGAAPRAGVQAVDRAFRHSVFLGAELGYGRIFLPEALNAVAPVNRPCGGAACANGGRP